MLDSNRSGLEYHPELEIKTKAKLFLTILDNVEKKVISTFEDIIKIDNVKPNSGDTTVRQRYDRSLRNMVIGVVNVHQTEMSEIRRMVDYFEGNEVIGSQYTHDISNFFGPVITGFNLLVEEINRDEYKNPTDDVMNERLRENIKGIVGHWYRCRVVLQDVLLRALSEKNIPKEYQKGVSMKALKSMLDFFSTKELANLTRFSQDGKSQYKGIDERFLDISSINWPDLERKLAGKKIKGNDGLIGNFLINALRNSLKERIDSSNVVLKMDVKGDEFVIRIEDDGKGMEPKHLDPNSIEKDTATEKRKGSFIFDKGVSDTGSSGLGLANFNDRVASVGGSLYVVSKRRGGNPEEKPTRYQLGGTEDEKEKINFNAMNGGTVFEIRLKLEDK